MDQEDPLYRDDVVQLICAEIRAMGREVSPDFVRSGMKSVIAGLRALFTACGVSVSHLNDLRLFMVGQSIYGLMTDTAKATFGVKEKEDSDDK